MLVGVVHLVALPAQPAVVAAGERIDDHVVRGRERRVVVGSVVGDAVRGADVEVELRVAQVGRVRVRDRRLAAVDGSVADRALHALAIDVVERRPVTGRRARPDVGRGRVAAQAEAAAARAILLRHRQRREEQRIAGGVRHHRPGPGVPGHEHRAGLGEKAAVAGLAVARARDWRAGGESARRRARGGGGAPGQQRGGKGKGSRASRHSTITIGSRSATGGQRGPATATPQGEAADLDPLLDLAGGEVDDRDVVRRAVGGVERLPSGLTAMPQGRAPTPSMRRDDLAGRRRR